MIKYINVKGHLVRTREELDRLRDEFDRATMATVGIQYDQKAIFKWLHWLLRKNIILGKSPSQLHERWLKGFPQGFATALMPDRMAPGGGLYVYPTHWPSWHQLAGQVCPHANHPWIELAAETLYPEWECHIREGLIKPLPGAW